MATFNKILLQGTLGTAAPEVWSTQIIYASPGDLAAVTDFDDLVAWATAIKAGFAVTGEFAGLKTLLSSSGALTTVRAQYLTGAPATVQQQGDSPATPVTGNATLSMPPQCSRVISLLTGRPGRSFRGRNYWPSLSGSISATLKVNSPSGQGLADEWVELYDLITASIPGAVALEPGVYSPTLDVVTSVTSVSVGDVIDTQRRRRDALVEIYSTATV